VQPGHRAFGQRDRAALAGQAYCPALGVPAVCPPAGTAQFCPQIGEPVSQLGCSSACERRSAIGKNVT
jgi:hypothetical protein